MSARARPENVLLRPTFTTPFKANMKPGEPGRLEAEKQKERNRLEAAGKRRATGAGAQGEGAKRRCLQSV